MDRFGRIMTTVGRVLGAGLIVADCVAALLVVMVIAMLHMQMGVLYMPKQPKVPPRTVATAQVMSCSAEQQLSDAEMLKLLDSPEGKNTRLPDNCPRP